MSLPDFGHRLTIALAGHVDHGKSTIVGRLLADSDALPEGKLAQVKAYCERNAKPFEYAFLVDALKNEQAQGVTIDAARVFYRVGDTEHVLIDAPGHVEFIRNMVTGASRADAALLVIDAQEGIRDNSRRHGALLALLGIRQLVVLVNKMDLVSFGAEVFRGIEQEFSAFLGHWGLKPDRFIPVSGLLGANVVQRSDAMKWYDGPTVAECISGFQPAKESSVKSFRMWVQDVYKFTNEGDTRRIVAGTIEAGSLTTGDQVIFLPSGRKSAISTIERFPGPGPTHAGPGEAVGFTLADQLFVGRGELMTRIDDPPPMVSSRFRSSLFWLGREPMKMGREYDLRIGSARTRFRIEELHGVQDGVTLAVKKSDTVGRHEIADCTIVTEKPVAFDPIGEIPATGRFVVVDQFEIRGGGIIREALEDMQTQVRAKVLLRDYRWERSAITADARAARFRQKPSVVIITGGKDSGKKPLARALEAGLYERGHLSFFLGIGNILYGVDADIHGKEGIRQEHIRRLAEVVHVLLEGGFVAIVTAIDLTNEDVAMFRTVVESERLLTIRIGSVGEPGIDADQLIRRGGDTQEAVASILHAMTNGGLIT